MTSNPITVSTDTSYKDIVNIMKNNKVGSVLVVDKENRLKDIITQSDLITLLIQGGLEQKVKDNIKDKKLITIDEDAHVFDAITYFEKFKIKHLPVLNSEKKVVGIITATDILEKLAYMGLVDPLTKLNNRNFFEILKMKYSGKVLNMTVIMADIDNFKKLNDKYGHLVGDKILQKVGKILKGDLRVYDEVIRWGGEEFLILLPRTNIGTATSIAERIRKKISQIKIEEFPEITVTISMGISHYEGDGALLDVAIDEADKALLQAKRSGKNRISIGKFIINDQFQIEKLKVEG
ncbi:diguanylate cyclase [Persephonella sp.]